MQKYDLIDRKELHRKLTIMGANAPKVQIRAFARCISELEIASTVDAAIVVHCKNCRYWQQEASPCEHWVCLHHSTVDRRFYTMPDFFCADGIVKLNFQEVEHGKDD